MALAAPLYVLRRCLVLGESCGPNLCACHGRLSIVIKGDPGGSNDLPGVPLPLARCLCAYLASFRSQSVHASLHTRKQTTTKNTGRQPHAGPSVAERGHPGSHHTSSHHHAGHHADHHHAGHHTTDPAAPPPGQPGPLHPSDVLPRQLLEPHVSTREDHDLSHSEASEL
eukprot:3902701-Prymnesium_polylepis.1